MFPMAVTTRQGVLQDTLDQSPISVLPCSDPFFPQEVLEGAQDGVRQGLLLHVEAQCSRNEPQPPQIRTDLPPVDSRLESPEEITVERNQQARVRVGRETPWGRQPTDCFVQVWEDRRGRPRPLLPHFRVLSENNPPGCHTRCPRYDEVVQLMLDFPHERVASFALFTSEHGEEMPQDFGSHRIMDVERIEEKQVPKLPQGFIFASVRDCIEEGNWIRT